MQNGDGVFSHPNGDCYKGQWMNGRPHGKGELLQISEYHKDALGDNVKGHEFDHWANRSKYIGMFKNGEKHGEGQLIW